MKRKLKEELVEMSKDIINSDGLNEIGELYDVARNLYEKLAVLKFIEEKLNDIEVDVTKNVIAAKFETMANAVLNANSLVPESNPHEEDIITPGMQTIKDIVSEMPSGVDVEEVLKEFMGKPDLMKNDKELFMPAVDSTIQSTMGKEAKTLNEKLAEKVLKIDLNNRLAFVKHLFNDSMEDYNRVLSQLNTIDSEERSIAFIENMVKPDHNNWEGKEEYEERFKALIIRKFS